MKELLGMKESATTICPVVRSASSYDELLRVGHDHLKKKILKSFNTIAEGKDYVIVEGTKAPWHLLHVDLSTPQIARELDAEILALVKFSDLTALDDILLQKEIFQKEGFERIGIILVQVPPMLKKTISQNISSFLEERGLKLCGVIYDNRELFSPTVQEIQRALKGQMVLGDDKMDLPIDQFIVGSMAPENALKWFRRAKDKAVITSGDRTDICLAALETDTNLLILTGGVGPDIATLSRARDLNVPIMMTANDTYTTSQIVDNLVGSVTADNPAKLAIVEHLIGDVLDLSFLNL
jgi:BioD-like phosphotransacetylase family protein